MITRTARSLGWFGPDARECLPALAHAVMLDAGDLPALVEAAVRIDLAAAIRAAGGKLEDNARDADRAVRLVTYLGRLGEEGPREARALAVQQLSEASLTATAATEAATWQKRLSPSQKKDD